MISQKLAQKQIQKLSPQQIQLMKLLQIPTATLHQRIKEELEVNPALEEGANNEEERYEEPEAEDQTEEVDYEIDEMIEEYFDEDPQVYQQKDPNIDSEDRSVPIASKDSFLDYLELQLGIAAISDPTEYLIALQIIGSIDEDGYLRREPHAIVDDLMFTQNVFVQPEQIETMLLEIQKFDPAGVGARDLRECLLLQIQRKQAKERDEILDLAELILSKYFQEFSKKHYEKLIKNLGITENELREVIHTILKLNPKPASGYSDGTKSADYVIPDFIVLNNGGELELTLNSRNAPELHVNDQYMHMLKDYQASKKSRGVSAKEKEAVVFIKQKIDSAKWFIDAIRQRQQTMFKTMYAILQFQKEFFLSGDDKMLKPMILKDISEVTDLDISTVSRVASSKYVQTEFGTFLLKNFFSESMQNQDGEEVSTREIKEILKNLVGEENKRKPLSDENLKKELEQKGYKIARRTVAKYREQLTIPVARLRKEI